uniref:Uncharacterized protein n=1 Tax=Romanomermis culicivorax TaxID=13658 RepID=A0A915KGN6_ROMCU
MLEQCRMKYENLLSEWSSVEAIVRERDKDAFLTARKDQRVKLIHQSNSLSSDVFVDNNYEKQDENSAAAIENGCIKKKIDYF